jgi:hypothetical protein
LDNLNPFFRACIYAYWSVVLIGLLWFASAYFRIDKD